MAYKPRLTDEGIKGDPKWYDLNPFYLSGYGLPNCTCYAWGRFWEIGDWTGQGIHKPTLPTGNGGEWFDSVTGYEKGQIAQLGAVACFSGGLGGAGHVAIVEEIKENSIVLSNSAYGGQFFFTYELTGRQWDDLTLQGFIYNPYSDDPTPPVPPIPPTNKHDIIPCWLLNLI